MIDLLMPIVNPIDGDMEVVAQSEVKTLYEGVSSRVFDCRRFAIDIIADKEFLKFLSNKFAAIVMSYFSGMMIGHNHNQFALNWMVQDLELVVGIRVSSSQFVHASSIMRIWICTCSPHEWNHLGFILYMGLCSLRGPSRRGLCHKELELQAKSIVEISGDFVMLAFVTQFYVGFDLWAKAFPCERLVDGIDVLSNS